MLLHDCFLREEKWGKSMWIYACLKIGWHDRLRDRANFLISKGNKSPN